MLPRPLETALRAKVDTTADVARRAVMRARYRDEARYLEAIVAQAVRAGQQGRQPES